MAERLPREIPFIFSTISIIILISIIIGHIFTISSLSKYIKKVSQKNYIVSLNVPDLNKIINILVEYIFYLNRKQKLYFDLKFLLKFVRTKIIPNTG